MLKKPLFFLSLVLVVFVSLHLFGVRLPLHQDEYKWVQYSHPEIIPPGTVPHPPLTEFIYTKIAPVFGDNGFRFVPFSFGILNLFLLYYLLNFLFNRKTAQIGVIIFTLSFFSLLSTLMVDVDGAVMPFFFLLLLIGYFKLKKQDYNLSKSSYKWLGLIIFGAVGGFLIKVSFVLAISAVLLDFLIDKRIFSDWRKILKYFLYCLAGMAVLVGILLLSKFIFPFFNLSNAFKYWEHFIVWDRGWFQTLIQCIKATLYISPFLFLLPLLITKEIFLKTRVFFIFLTLAFIFYVVLFDFSIGALDRYLQLLVLPAVVFSSAILAEVNFKEKRSKEFLFLGLIIGIIIVLLQSLPHFIPPLHPKTEWIQRALSFRWNFVYPFSGGSGPLGFYVSFLVLTLSWIITSIAVLFALYKPKYRNLIIILVLPIGFIYNGIFIEEYLFGFWNGHAGRLLAPAVEYIKNNPNIKMVTVYNDNGGNEIQQIGKYRKRLYIDPKFDIVAKVENLNRYKEHYFVLDIPRIDPGTLYQKYFDSCEVMYEKKDKKISAIIYDCTKAPDIKI